MSPNSCVIREVAKDVWTFSCPFQLFNLFPVGGRTTAVRLRSGDVWVLASTPLCESTKTKLRELGPVKWIIGADEYHHLYLAEFKREYPEAKLVAVEAAREKKATYGLTFDGAWGADPPGTEYGFEHDIKHCYFSGFKNKDVAFLHLASKSLIQADLLFNMPAREQYSLAARPGPLLTFQSLNPYSSINRWVVWFLGVDKEAMKRDARTVAGWDFERIIPCHGDIIEENAKSAWNEAYKWYL
ncbi:hypothetical protein BD310DRAFT_933782 [Dichomitus squalens]|uniref:Beta-lactamase-like protein n=1 Tax=Dichomitus squalens TaxID=114155 RepID=A0A4V2K7A9_9APHY|nr:hypothetical protein BD310DRAFT_933782 [Dichomitus squalens]